MPRVVHFELPADDLERAQRFYGEVFGWEFKRWDGPMPYVLVTTGKEERGIDGGLLPRQARGAGTVNTIDVPSVDEYLGRILEKGGKVALPKMAVPGVGWLAYAIDTEGNTFGIMQADEKAR
jgi:predicted enzyme related to lactoylglutathione lyase